MEFSSTNAVIILYSLFSLLPSHAVFLCALPLALQGSVTGAGGACEIVLSVQI